MGKLGAAETWSQRATAGHSPPQLPKEGMMDWEGSLGMPRLGKCSSIPVSQPSVADWEPCLGNKPFGSDMTIAPFCDVVAVLPAQPGYKADAHLHRLV